MIAAILAVLAFAAILAAAMIIAVLDAWAAHKVLSWYWPELLAYATIARLFALSTVLQMLHRHASKSDGKTWSALWTALAAPFVLLAIAWMMRWVLL